MKNIDVAIIGAGPAGLAAGIELYKNNVKNIMIFERNQYLGGILNQCIHSGFGIDYYKDDLTGPEYAYKMKEYFLKLKIPFKINTMVINITKDKILTVSSFKNGIEQYKARSIIMATGCRERTRENMEIPGTRPSGVWTAGQAQDLINLKNFKIGKNAIIQGSGDIGLIMARRLFIEGYNVIKVFERLSYLSGLIRNKVQCLDDFGIPIEFNTQICQIEGNDRVEGVFVERLDDRLCPVPNSKKYYKCDTVLFSVGLIPEVELLKNVGIKIINNINPEVNSKYETKISGIFIAGNSLHIHDLADNASLEGELVATYVIEYLKKYNKFRLNVKNKIPYKQKTYDLKFNNSFFKNQKNSKICIICPKGCLVNSKKYGCLKGRDFFNKENICKKRKLTTSIYCNFKGILKNIPIITREDIDIKNTKLIMKKLKKIKKLNRLEFSININKEKINFIGTDL